MVLLTSISSSIKNSSSSVPFFCFKRTMLKKMALMKPAEGWTKEFIKIRKKGTSPKIFLQISLNRGKNQTKQNDGIHQMKAVIKKNLKKKRKSKKKKKRKRKRKYFFLPNRKLLLREVMAKIIKKFRNKEREMGR